MKDTKRALRRHHRQRMIARTMRLLVPSSMPQEDRLQWVLRSYKNRQRCSCYMCGHHRENYGPTVQERRQPPAEEFEVDDEML